MVLLSMQASAQDFKKVVEIIANMESSLKKIIGDEKTQRENETAHLKTELQALRQSSSDGVMLASAPAVSADKPSPAVNIPLPPDSSVLHESITAPVQNETQPSPPLSAAVKFGADVMSRYVWRGVDYGNAPSIQPSISYTAGALSVGTWGAYSLGSFGTDSSGNAKVFAEHDLWASYGISSSAGTFSILFTGYFYPSNGLKYFNFNSTGGSHVLEAGLSYTGLESFPVTAAVYYNFHNDVDHSAYVQVSYGLTAETYGLTLFAGATPAKSSWYVTTDAAFINVGLTLTKSIKMTDAFSLPVSATYAVNPHIEQSYLIFGMSF
jgi:hypothetical protein